MNVKLFQELYELNQAFERVIEGLKRMERQARPCPRSSVNGARKS
jgi:hypothetical protein